VEALAAFNIDGLVRLSTDWTRPDHIGDDPWWTAAWTTALRHLKAAGSINRQDADVPALSREVVALWDKPAQIANSWLGLQQILLSPFSRYDQCRQSASIPLIDEAIARTDLEIAHWEMLRVLRGRFHLLDETAVAWLLIRLRSWSSLDPLEAALIFEACAGVAPDEMARICGEMAKHVRTIKDARHMIPSSYVLISDWRAP
jgi:hypothetical protein